jgi:hypothetical protein
MRHRPLNGMVNERANGSETGTGIENKENDRARERSGSGSGSENGTVRLCQERLR